MSTALVVVLAIVALIVLLAVGGAIAQRRRLTANTEAFEAHLGQANADLAAARAEDRGWDRATMEAAARDGYTRQRPDAGAPALTLVRVLDRPGTDEDKAVFRAGDGEQITLGRQDGTWVVEGIE